MSVREVMRSITVDQYLEENGMADNLTASEKRGLDKLKKRVDNKDLVVKKLKNLEN